MTKGFKQVPWPRNPLSNRNLKSNVLVTDIVSWFGYVEIWNLNIYFDYFREFFLKNWKKCKTKNKPIPIKLFSTFKLLHNQIGWWDCEDANLTNQNERFHPSFSLFFLFHQKLNSLQLNYIHMLSWLKVRKARKQIMVSSILPKKKNAGIIFTT